MTEIYPEKTNVFIKGISENPVPLSELVDHLPNSIVILDKDGRILFMNQAMMALTGFQRSEALNQYCKYIIRSNLCSSQCPCRELQSDSEPVCREGNIISKNREKIPIRFTLSPLQDAHEGFVGWLECLEDLRSVQAYKEKELQAFSVGSLIGRSLQMDRVFQIIPDIAQTDSSVLITGETGTGKDALAEAIHENSPRAKGPFVKVNCGALPETLLESELFGHQKGAFTGATGNKPGRFKLAHNGTLFLTEIGDLPHSLQVKLLSFLDDQIIYPLGSTKGTQVNVRIIAATHQDLSRMVEEKKFRHDLLYRLNVVRMHLPSLREREGDIELLLDHFLHNYSQKFNKSIKGFSQEALHFLARYSYPGNVRELQNIVEFSVNICRQETIEMEHLPNYLNESRFEDVARTNPEQEQSESSLPSAGEVTDAEFQGVKEKVNSWSEAEKEMIMQALLKAKGKKQKAAEILGWGRSTLWRKMKQHNID